MNLRQKRKRAIEAKHYNAGRPDKQEYRVFYTTLPSKKGLENGADPEGFRGFATVGATSRNEAIKFAKSHILKVHGGDKSFLNSLKSFKAEPAYRDYLPRPLNKPKNSQDRVFYGNSSWNDYGKIRGTDKELGFLK